jgi:VanZ family protein
MRVLSIYFVVLAFLSLNPWLLPDPHQAIGTLSWDKIDHAGAYGLLSLLLMSAFRYRKQRWLVSLMVLLACFAVGGLFEYCQLWFTPTRHFSYYDALANGFGALLGVIVFWCYEVAASLLPKTCQKAG